MIDTDNITDVELDGIDTKDYPKFCDAFICGAAWITSGVPLTEIELDELNEDYDFVYNQVMDYFF